MLLAFPSWHGTFSALFSMTGLSSSIFARLGRFTILGLINPTRIERNDDLCVHCGLCSKVCPVNINVAKEERVTGTECLSCNECVVACPRSGALEIKTAGRALYPVTVLLIAVRLFFGSILSAQMTGYYQVLPAHGKEKLVLTSGEKTLNKIDVMNIKGSLTIKEAAESINMDMQDFYRLFRIPETVPDEIKMKDISGQVDGYNFHKIKSELK